MKYIALLFIFISCSKETTISREALLEKASEADPELEVMIPPSLDKPLVYCNRYRPPCVAGYKIKIKRLEVTALEYETEKAAYKSAKFIKGYVLHNWVFDDVTGEPILERFFTEQIGAKKAIKKPE